MRSWRRNQGARLGFAQTRRSSLSEPNRNPLGGLVSDDGCADLLVGKIAKSLQDRVFVLL